jgi:hypothetical protein
MFIPAKFVDSKHLTQGTFTISSLSQMFCHEEKKNLLPVPELGPGIVHPVA